MSNITQGTTTNYLSQLSTIAQAVDLVEQGKNPRAGFFVYADRFHLIRESLEKKDKEKLPEELKTKLASLSDRMSKISAKALGAELQHALTHDQADIACKIFRISNFSSTPLPNGELPSHYAIRCGSRSTIRRLIQENLLDPAPRDHQNLTMMDHALLDDQDMAKFCLRELLPSANLSDEIFASLALRSKNDIESAFAHFQPFIHIPATSLPAPHQAAFLGDRKKLEALAATSPHLDAPLPAWIAGNAESEMTPLHFAALGQQPDLFEFLLEKGCNPNALTSSGKNALHLAVIKDDYNTVKKILSLPGCEVDLPDRLGMTPLRYAIQTQNLKVISLLVSKGADLSRQVKGVSLLEMLWFKLKEGASLRDPLAPNPDLLARLAIAGFSRGLETLRMQDWMQRNRAFEGATYFTKEADFSFPFLSWNWRGIGINGSSLYDFGWNAGLGVLYSTFAHSWAPLRFGGHAIRGLISLKSAYQGAKICWRNRHCEWKRPLLRSALHLLDVMDAAWKIRQSALAMYHEKLQPEEEFANWFWKRWNPRPDESQCPTSLTPAEEKAAKLASDTIVGCFDGNVSHRDKSKDASKKINECLQSNLQLLHDAWKDLNPGCPIYARAILERAGQTTVEALDPQVNEGMFGAFTSIISSITEHNNVPPTADAPIAAKQMFRALAPAIHPDKIHDKALKTLAETVHLQISDAYDTLTSKP